MVLLETVTDGSWFGFLNALLNTLQTVALAYLAADRHVTTRMRNAGVGTRSTDVTPPHQ
jgi:hypothetical protein